MLPEELSIYVFVVLVLILARLTGDNLDLSDTVGVTENDTNLRRSGTLTGELADLVDDLLGGGLQPRWGSAGVGESAGRYALSVTVKATHFGCGGELSGLKLGGLVVMSSFVSNSEVRDGVRKCISTPSIVGLGTGNNRTSRS